MRRSLQKYSLVLFTALLFLPCKACKQNSAADQPALSADRMANILAVVYISEVKVIRHFDLRTQKDAYLKRYLYPVLFDSLGVDSAEFYQSYSWYEQKPDVFEILMDSVTVRIDRMPADSADQTEFHDRSLDDVYRELNRIERVNAAESRQPADER
jgi:hypothetical protein